MSIQIKLRPTKMDHILNFLSGFVLCARLTNHYEMQKKFGVYTTFSVDGKKFHPIPIGEVRKGLIPI